MSMRCASRLFWASFGAQIFAPAVLAITRVSLGACLFLVLLPISISIAASGRTYFDDDYLIDSWETEDGLPENSATAMVQTPDGYLWFGTFNGLVRFDGIKFTVHNPSNTPDLPSARVVNLHLDASNRLWVSTFRGLAVSVSNEWTKFRSEPKWTGDYVRTFSEHAGVLCITSFDGKIFRFQNGQLEEIPPPPGTHKQGFLGSVDQQGRLWVQEEQSSYVGWWDGLQWNRWELTTKPNPELIFIQGLPDGRWLAVQDTELAYVDDGRIVTRLPLLSPVLKRGVWSVYQDRDKMVWISAQYGLIRITPSGQVRYFTAAKELTYNSVRFSFQDRESNLWVGTSGGGLMRFKPRKFMTYDKEHGLGERNVKAIVEEASGQILIGTFGAGLFRWQGGQISPVQSTHQPHVPWTQCLLRDSRKNLWIGGYSGNTNEFPLTVITSQGRQSVSARDSGGVSVRALFEDSQGRIWIGGGKTLSLYANGEFHSQAAAPSELLSDVRHLAESQGIIWAAGGNGLSQLREGQWLEVKDSDNRSLDDVFCLHTQPDGTLWLSAAKRGLLRLKNGQWSSVSEIHGLPSGDIYNILEDDLGFWWLGSNRGIIRVSSASLSQVADGILPKLHGQLFDQSDGLASVECTAGMQSNALKDRQGRLWFATLKGVAVVDPRNLKFNTNPPPIHLEALSYTDRRGKRVKYLAGKDWPFQEAPVVGAWAKMSVPPGSSQFEAHFAVLSFTAPEKVLLNYQLDQNNQVFISDQEQARMIASRWLPPGHYHLKVKAANNDGYWNEEGMSLAFAVQPFIWQTLWFRAGMILLIGGGIGASMGRRHRHRLRQAEERFRQQQALAEERARSSALTQFASDVIVLFSAEGLITYESPSTSRLLGYPEGFLIGKEPSAFIHPEDLEMVSTALREVIEGRNDGLPTVFRFRHARGHWIELESLGTNLLHHPGVRGIMVTSRDITERRKAEEALRRSEERMRLFFERQLVGMAITSPHKNWVQVNDRLCEMLGYSREELVDLTWADLTHPDDLPADTMAFNRLLSGEINEYNLEKRFIRKDQSIIRTNLSVAGVRHKNGLVDYVLALVEDITTRKLAEEELKASERRARRQRAAITALLLDEAIVCGELPEAFGRITAILAKAIAVNRTSIWLLSKDGSELRCHSLFGASGSTAKQGMVLKTSHLPHYVAALRAEGRLYVADALLDPRTCELALRYLAPLGISSLLDAGILIKGELAGVVCLEHTGETRKWHADEEAFASTAAAIVAQVLAGRDLRESEERFRSLSNSSLEGIMIHEQGTILDANLACARLFGYERPEDLVGLNGLGVLLTPESRERILQRMQRQESGPVEVMGIRKNGTTFAAETESQPVKYLGREARIVSCHDITDRKRVEEALRHTHEQLINIIESLPDPTFVIDRDKKVIAWNHAIEILSGVSKAEMLGQGDYAYAVPFFGRKQPLLIDFLDAMPEETDSAYKYLQVVGDKVYAESYLPSVYQGQGAHLWGVAVPLYDRHGIRWGAIEVIRDVTDQVKASLRLRENEEKYRSIFENAGNAIFMLDNDRITECNSRTLEMFGCTRKQILDLTPYNLSPPVQPDGRDSREKALAFIRKAVNDGTNSFEWLHTKYDGQAFEAEVTLSRIEVEGRIFLQAIVRDITERKRSERELLHLQSLLRNMINSMPSILVAVDAQGNVTQWNQSAEKTTGLRASQVCGSPLEKGLPFLADRLNSVRAAIQLRQSQALTKQASKVDDEIRYHDLVIYPLIANGVDGAVIRLDDVTERVRVEELMIQTEKMISVGGLAAGMAHEINNPLGIITQAAQNILRRISPELPANQKTAQALGLDLEHLRAYFQQRQIFQFAQDIRDASARAAHIVANMLQFSRKSQSAHQSYSVVDVLEKTLELAANDYDLKKKYDFRNIEVIRDYDPTAPSIPLILVEIEQVFFNLIKNAAQAMASNPPERKPCLRLRVKRDEKYAVVEVEDNGPGMESKVMRRVFEPFFTTKDPGVGTGLGLSVSYMIVTQNHKGLITVDSEPGRGARFTVRLPLSGTE